MYAALTDGTFRFIGIKTGLISTSWNRFFYVDKLQFVVVLIRINLKKKKNPFSFAISMKFRQVGMYHQRSILSKTGYPFKYLIRNQREAKSQCEIENAY